MRFFFPDSQDQIDPSFDFETESRSETRVRQRDDLYAHEALASVPYDGVLVSKAMVDGVSNSAGRYTFAQRNRMYRVGVRRFFRISDPGIQTLGDCGAFTYVGEEEPPYSVDDVIDFYEGCGFDLGISVDHIILGYLDTAGALPGTAPPTPEGWRARQEITLSLAADFLRRHRERRCHFIPLGVAQGWDPVSYARAVLELQRIGYRRIALGGMVPLKTDQILQCLGAIDDERERQTELHLLGVTRCEHLERLASYGVTSFDSTSPFRQAFKDDRDNFYTLERTFTAIRVPQVDGNARLKRRILSGELDQREAVLLERASLDAIAGFDRGASSATDVLDALDAYDSFLGNRSRRSEYGETLKARPWEECACGVCESAGIHVAVFRGTERNKRRGFHNLHVFSQRLERHIAASLTAATQEVFT